MEEISKIIVILGKAIDRALVYGQPCDDLRQAYELALRVKASMMP